MGVAAPESLTGRPEPPSGRQIRITHGDQELVVTEVGATLRSYSVGDIPVLAGFAEDQMCPDARGQLLLPWPNRLGDGSYRFGGREHQLPIDEPELRNSIHGLTSWANWVAEPRGRARVAVHHQLHPRPGYPFNLRLTAQFDLDATGLTVSVSAVNAGTEPAPFGAGAHPYVGVGTPVVDGCRLQVPARTYLLSDQRLLPLGRASVEGTELDFRTGRAIGTTRLDTPYTDLIRDPDGVARVSLQAPDGRRVVVWLDETYRWVLVFTGDTNPDPGQWRTSLAVEPMTCPPDAFRSGEDLIVLEPGEAVTARWGIDVTGFRHLARAARPG
ncbi:MAG TPA: aldose 1-epimerase family protein [Candidatus Binatia bacterium]|nr:aldose 1-epimerase family protein [Candidatus Binatia bacterium]